MDSFKKLFISVRLDKMSEHHESATMHTHKQEKKVITEGQSGVTWGLEAANPVCIDFSICVN